MNGRDLNQFQFDYDQTWAVLLLRADGTVLARYGSRESTDAMTLNSMEGLTVTMLRALEAHRNWPRREELYRDKRGPVGEFHHPEEIASQTIQNILMRGREASQNCIHCHNVYDAQRDVAIRRGDYDPRKRWKYPMPERIGIEVDPASGTTIANVLSGSPAASAGVEVGAEIESINGQAIHSLADIQFVLHFLPETAVARLVTGRAGMPAVERLLHLEPGWRQGGIDWRASMYGMPPKPGLWVQDAADEERRQLAISLTDLALKVRGVFGAEVRASGLKEGDVIVQFGERTDRHSEGQFHAALRLNYYRPDSVLPLIVIRDREKVDIRVEFENR